MGCNVEMNNPRWPSLREAARRFLKAEGCELSVPNTHTEQAWELVQAISDNIPARLNLPTVIEGEIQVEGLFKLGGEEPPLDICWVTECSWDDFNEQVLELLEAGYPGCVGCAGPGAEGEWNESARRREFSS
tara:strand:+ start:1489 stop:1884 length:396 start_codon:yes stop_codon:yes gene_type:complete